MLVCSSCYTECPDNANFCLNCGKSLKSESTPNFDENVESESILSNKTMTQALRRLMPTSYVEKLLAAKGQIEGERRVVTILFSDIKGSTSLAENLDPEEVLEIMNGAFDALIEPITRYEGTLARLMGDAILAFFGAPIAHEDDPYRACKAALDILRNINNYSIKLENEKSIKGFSVRVGINTGLVVVAEVGADLRVEYTAMGDAVNVAARMESSAEPGTILITEATKKLITNDFEVIPVGPIQVKGKTKSINSYKVVGLKNKNEPAFSGYHLPLIGREVELEQLKIALAKLKQGQGKIISVIGDQGIGKSKLVNESKNFKTPDIQWAEGRALSYTLKNSYWVTRNILQDHLGYRHDAPEDNIKKILRNKLEKNSNQPFKEIYPFLLHLLNLPLEAEYKKQIESENAESVKGGIHYSVKKFFELELKERPLVLAWEDLHWSDTSSLELLNELFDLTEKFPLLLLLIYRINESEGDIWKFHYDNLLNFKGNPEVIALETLTDEESKKLVENLGVSSKLSGDLIERIIKRTEGNPFFLKELVNSVIDKGVLEIKEGDSVSKIFKQELEIPDLLHSIVMAKIDHLAPLEKLTLQTASVIGRIFTKKHLTQILQNDVSDTELEKSLNELQLRELILRHLPSNVGTLNTIKDKEYIIKDNLVQDVLYRTILKTQRQKLHKMTAEAIENLYAQNIDDYVEILATHYEKGQDWKKAANYYKRAAYKAKSIYANDDAIYFYSKALKLSELISEDSSHFIEIYEHLGDIYLILAKYDVAIQHYNKLLKYYKVPVDLGRIYYKCGQIFERWGKYREALEYLNNGLKLLQNQKEHSVLSQIHLGIGMVYYRQEKYTEAIELTEHALEIIEKSGVESDIADIYNNLGIFYCKLGDVEKSLENHKKCLIIREKLGNKNSLAASYNNLGYLSYLQKDLQVASEYFTRSMELCEKTGNYHGLARTYDNLSNLYNAIGNNELAMEYNVKAITILGKIARQGTEINSEVWLQSGVW